MTILMTFCISRIYLEPLAEETIPDCTIQADLLVPVPVTMT